MADYGMCCGPEEAGACVREHEARIKAEQQEFQRAAFGFVLGVLTSIAFVGIAAVCYFLG